MTHPEPLEGTPGYEVDQALDVEKHLAADVGPVAEGLPEGSRVVLIGGNRAEMQ